MELIKSEKDYIDDLNRCICYYLAAYRKASNTVPLSLRNKEKEIFGNIEQLYRFHSELVFLAYFWRLFFLNFLQQLIFKFFFKNFSIIIFLLRTFLPQLVKYENEPEDVGYCFIFSVEMLNSLYTEYCVNKEQNNYLIALPETVQFFSVNCYIAISFYSLYFFRFHNNA